MNNETTHTAGTIRNAMALALSRTIANNPAGGLPAKRVDHQIDGLYVVVYGRDRKVQVTHDAMHYSATVTKGNNLGRVVSTVAR